MKFATLLKSNKLQGWEDFYIKYEILMNYLKSDTDKFKKLLIEEFEKITTFFNEIEEQTEEQKNGILIFIRNNLEEEMLNMTHTREKQKNIELIRIINKVINNSEKTDDTGMNILETEDFLTNSEGSASFGGEESDYENINVVKNSKLEEMEKNNFYEINNFKPKNKEDEYLHDKKQKKTFFSFGSFKINKQFENRKNEKAFHEILQAINSVKSYRDINIMAITVVIRKYKNKKGSDEFSSEILKKLHQSYFCRSKKVDSMQKDMRHIYKKIFAKNDNLKARNIFKKIGKKSKTDPCITFLIGILISVFAFVYHNIDFTKNKQVKAVVDNLGLIQLGFFLFGVCDLVFLKYNINCDLIFNFDVISGLSPIILMLHLAIITNLTFISIYFFIASHPKILTYVLITFNLFVLFAPLKIFWYKSRLYFMSVFAGILVSGFRKVYFKHFLFADIFQSYTPCIKIIIYELGLVNKSVYSSVTLSTLFPIIRILQCYNRYKDTNAKFPHLFNLTKYVIVLINLTVESISKYLLASDAKSLIYLLRTISSSYSILWDFFLDWTIQREKKCFPLYFYVVGSVYNILARCCWVLKAFEIFTDETFYTIVEIIRRFVWLLFRVENEHVNNCTDEKSKLGILFSKELFFVKDNNKRDSLLLEEEKV